MFVIYYTIFNYIDNSYFEYAYSIIMTGTDLFIGMSTKTLIRHYLEDGSISEFQVTKFYRAVRSFYIKAFEYSLTHLPISDTLLQNATYLDFSRRAQSTFSQVEYFVERYALNLCNIVY